MSLRVLFVCTGNICRSPMAERMLQARLDKSGSAAVTTSSAGTRAVVGHPMDALAARVLREHGGEPDGHRGRQLSADLVETADLVLTADSAHRSRVVREVPLAMRRTFTLREFARLGAALDPPRPTPAGDRLQRRVAEIAARRGEAPPAEPGGDDIGDPFGAPLPVMQMCGQQIAAVIDQICGILGVAQSS
ncbi:MAG TPA: hypothetical protein VFH38_01920 [Jatrophihabitans sp.]|nr:hypothetical protein [Jatrophihabitans sp.]